MKVDFIFDVASPNAYMVYKILPEFQKRLGLNLIIFHAYWVELCT